MPGYFITDEVDRIKVDKGHWVDIKHKMSYGDQQTLVDSFVRMQAQPTIKTPDDVDFSIRLGNVTLLCLNIKAWNLEDASGKIPPINEDTIRQLDDPLARKLVKEINKRNQPPKV